MFGLRDQNHKIHQICCVNHLHDNNTINLRLKIKDPNAPNALYSPMAMLYFWPMVKNPGEWLSSSKKVSWYRGDAITTEMKAKTGRVLINALTFRWPVSSDVLRKINTHTQTQWIKNSFFLVVINVLMRNRPTNYISVNINRRRRERIKKNGINSKRIEYLVMR